jgi:hypothetical protein
MVARIYVPAKGSASHTRVYLESSGPKNAAEDPMKMTVLMAVGALSGFTKSVAVKRTLFVQAFDIPCGTAPVRWEGK